MKQVFTILSILIIYILWMPLALLKDIACIFYTPFDASRFLDTYQKLYNNLYSLSKIHNTLHKNRDEELSVEIDKPYEKQSIGFKTFESNAGIIEDDMDEYEELEEVV